jgi:hypothetical protein
LARSEKRYLPSHKRTDQPPQMRLTPRDKEIILAVYEYRLLTSHQIEALIFPSKKLHSKRTNCQTRLQRLFHHGFLKRLPITLILGEGRPPFRYVLDKKGADLVARLKEVDRGNLEWKSNQDPKGISFIEHSLEINNVRLIVHRLMELGQWEVVDWVNDYEFKSKEYKDKVPYRTFGSRVERILPDSFFRLDLPGQEQDAFFFLEVDRGKMPNSDWAKKIKSYTQYRSAGAAYRHYGTHNFRVLTIVSTKDRMRNLMKTTERVGGDHYFWFASQEDIDIWRPNCLLEPIWSVVGREGKHKLFS